MRNSYTEYSGQSIQFGLTLLLLAGCTATVQPPKYFADELSSALQQLQTPAGTRDWMAQGLRRSADPCKDFYEYACGGRDPNRPDGKPAFAVATTGARLQAWDILTGIAAHPDADPRARMVGDFFASCVQEKEKHWHGDVAAKKKFLRSFDSVQNIDSFMTVLGVLHRQGVPALFDVEITFAQNARSRYVLQFRQGALGLGQPQAYLSDTEIMKELRRQYKSLIRTQMDALHWEEDPEVAAEAVMQVESELARQSLRPYELASSSARRALTVAELEQQTGLPWRPYLQALGPADQDTIEVVPIDYFRTLGAQLRRLDPQGLRSYVRWHALSKTSALWAGFIVLQPPWELCVEATEAAFGRWLWRSHAAAHGGDEISAQVEQMWRAVQSVLAGRVAGAQWLGSEAMPLSQKVNSVRPLISYPRQLDWDPIIAVTSNDFFGNVLASRTAWSDHETAMLRQPMEADNLIGPPSISMPGNVLDLDRVVVPWSVLQPPVFSPRAAPAINFGHLGTILGHELGHSIDRAGRRFDAEGQVAAGADPSLALAQQEECVGRNFNHFEAAPSAYFYPTASTLPPVPVDPDLTRDEDFADVVGVHAAFAAYKQQFRSGETTTAIPEGLTDDQAFFVAFAQNWCGEPQKHMRQFLAEFDAHATPRARVNGTLSALPEFADAFQCQPGSPMRSSESCELF